VLEAGKPLLFGKTKDKGIRLNGLTPEVCDATAPDVLIHRPDHPSPLYSQMLASMGLPDFPTPIGVIRSIQRPTYETQLQGQILESQAKRGGGSWKELLHGSSTWTIE
jgi:2-oxoglutarate ferredoxin oxidoreductase subunit beta